jgi:hypothetical protein
VMSDGSPIGSQAEKLDHQLLGLPKPGGDDERRSCRRRAFFAIQRIAPITGPQMPHETEFFCVESRDLTSHGISLFMPARPTFTSLVIAFDGSPTTEYVAAEVIHCTEVLVYPSGLIEPLADQSDGSARNAARDGPGELMVLVGCRLDRTKNEFTIWQSN